MIPTPEMIEAAKSIADQINKAMDGVTDGPWEVYEGCSWRRIGTRGPGYNDCAVLAPMVSSDGHPDLTCHRGNDLHANLGYIALCNPANMRVLLSAFEALAILPGEPVAWQWRQTYAGRWGNWNDCGVSATDVQKWRDLAEKLPNEVQVRPLYASPAPLPVAVKKAQWHATALRQCAIFAADVGDNIAKAMTDAADFLSSLQSPASVSNWTDLEENALQAAADANARQPGYINATETRFVKAAISSIRSALSSPVGETDGKPTTVPCPCTMVQQDETCPVGYPSLLCDACDGKGHINIVPPHEAIERLRAYAHGSNAVKFDTYDAADVIGFLETIDTTPASDIAALREGNERLKEALWPFAKVAEKDIGETEHEADLFVPAHAHNRAPRLVVGDFRRAFSALQHVAKGERG